MDYQVIDNFLPFEQFKRLEHLTMYNADFPYTIRQFVANSPDEKTKFVEEVESQYWNWYAVHQFYNHIQLSPHCNDITHLFLRKFDEMEMVKSLIRIKVNFYPWTNVVYEHVSHTDYPFENKGAVYSLNTCDGYTRMPNGDKVESVANRIVFFDASLPHSSSTTSNAKGRFNINFNWL